MKNIFLICVLIITSACNSNAEPAVGQWMTSLNIKSDPWQPSDYPTKSHYFSYDVREEEKSGALAFDCEINDTQLKPSLNWYFGNTEFPFSGENVTVDIYINKQFIFTLLGKNLGVYEGVVFLNKQEFQRIIEVMSVGNKMDVFIYNEKLKIEEHLIISLKGFSAEHPIMRCFQFL